MTTEQAIYQLTDLIKDRESFCRRDDLVNTPCHVKAFDSDTETVYTYSCVKCPVCSKWIVANVNHKCCQYCGQALDWSE